jgi:hypothetical protein
MMFTNKLQNMTEVGNEIFMDLGAASCPSNILTILHNIYISIKLKSTVVSIGMTYLSSSLHLLTLRIVGVPISC